MKAKCLVFCLFTAGALNVHAGVIYSFSFNNVIGTVAGTVQGEIQLDFLTSLTDNGTGAASRIEITSVPAGIPASIEGDVVTGWMTQSLNTFTVVGGTLTSYQFGASEGATPGLSDNVMCLNSGGFFVVGGVYVCGPGENYFGDAFSYVYNVDGIGGVIFEARQVPEPPMFALLVVGLMGLGLRGAVIMRRANAKGS